MASWNEARRAELLETFRREVYGQIPVEDGLSCTFRVADSRRGVMNGNASRKVIEIIAVRKERQFIFPLVLFIPAGTTPAPVILTLCLGGVPDADPGRHFLRPSWPAETIVSRGFAAAVVITHDIAPDYEENFSLGFHRLFPEFSENRPAHAWGTISAWAWGMSRAIDYLQSDKDIRGDKIAVAGHSRAGKTALWCAAQDNRAALAISSCSGCSGAAITRGKTGEHIRDITGRFPFWFSRNYQKYAHNEEDLPVDQHILLGLIAPRPLYVSSRTNDSWADPKSEFESCRQASAIYHLYGKTGLEQDEMPPPEMPLLAGSIGYHVKTGEHALDEYDWERYLDFCTRKFA
jgi:hypothetical protein